MAVYWVMTPSPPSLQARLNQSRYEARYEEGVRRLLERHPHVTVLDARHAGFPAESVHDIAHLDRTGATALSESIAPYLAGKPPEPSGRWVKLAGAMPPLSEERVEDLAESGRVVEGAARRGVWR